MKLPAGKGMWINQVMSRFGTPDALAELAVSRGIDWVAPLAFWEEEGGNQRTFNMQDALPFASALERSGVAVYPWAYLVPPAFGLDTIIEVARAWGSRGYILDLEVEWYNLADGDAAGMLGTDTPGMAVGITTYGAGWYHPLPSRGFCEVADFIVPQCYDMGTGNLNQRTKDQQGMSYPALANQWWTAEGARSVQILTAAFGKGATKVTMPILSQDSADASDGAVSWWQWLTADDYPWRWEVVRNTAGPSREFRAANVQTGGGLGLSLALAAVVAFMASRA